MRLVDHLAHRVEHQVHAEAVARCKPTREGLVRLDDADDLDITALLATEDPVHMIVRHADDTNAQWCGRGLRRRNDEPVRLRGVRRLW